MMRFVDTKKIEDGKPAGEGGRGRMLFSRPPFLANTAPPSPLLVLHPNISPCPSTYMYCTEQYSGINVVL